MCLLAILVALVIIAAVVLFTIVGTVGGVFVVLFGDIIIFAAVVWAIVKLIKYFKKRK